MQIKKPCDARLSNFGWKMGFEPTTFGTTIRHSNQLSYIHHLDLVAQIGCKCNTLFRKVQIFRQEICKKLLHGTQSQKIKQRFYYKQSSFFVSPAIMSQKNVYICLNNITVSLKTIL